MCRHAVRGAASHCAHQGARSFLWQISSVLRTKLTLALCRGSCSDMCTARNTCTRRSSPRSALGDPLQRLRATRAQCGPSLCAAGCVRLVRPFRCALVNHAAMDRPQPSPVSPRLRREVAASRRLHTEHNAERTGHPLQDVSYAMDQKTSRDDASRGRAGAGAAGTATGTGVGAAGRTRRQATATVYRASPVATT